MTWSYSAGDRPYTVVVFERKPGGMLYARAWQPKGTGSKGKWIRQSLKHRDRAEAKRYAKVESEKLAANGKVGLGERITLARVFALYLKYRTPRKTSGQQKADARRAELWTRVLGAGLDPHLVSLGQWEWFLAARGAGAIDARGNAVPEEVRQTVRVRPIEADCAWLRLTFNWAVKWRLPSGAYVMRENPIRGFDTPTEKNPRRPMATAEYFEGVRTAAEQHTMQLRVVGGKWRRLQAPARAVGYRRRDSTPHHRHLLPSGQ